MAARRTDKEFINVGDNIWRCRDDDKWFAYLTDEGYYIIKVLLYHVPNYDVSFGKTVVKEYIRKTGHKTSSASMDRHSHASAALYYHRFEDHHHCFKVRTTQRAADEGREMPTMFGEEELKVPEDEHRELTNGELTNGEHAHYRQ
ncbi:MAG: hypothetical protein Q9159_006216 [Coniocarpon cinnabarinum]